MKITKIIIIIFEGLIDVPNWHIHYDICICHRGDARNDYVKINIFQFMVFVLGGKITFYGK